MGGDVDHVDRTSRGRELLPELAALPGHVLWRARARVTSSLDEVLPPGVDLHAYAALLALAGGVTRSQQRLAESISVSRTTMARVAADLAAHDLVERVRNPDDRRSYALTRTPEGIAATRRWRRHAEDLEAALTAGFADAERQELRALLRQVVGDDLAPDAPDALRESLGFLVVRAHARVHRSVSDALAPIDVEPRHLGTLTALRALGPIPQAELARTLGVTPATTVQIVDGLERRGLVERRRPPGDRRTHELHLTPRAAAVAGDVRRLARPAVAAVLADLDEAETARLVALLVRFVTAPQG